MVVMIDMTINWLINLLGGIPAKEASSMRREITSLKGDVVYLETVRDRQLSFFSALAKATTEKKEIRLDYQPERIEECSHCGGNFQCGAGIAASGDGSSVAYLRDGSLDGCTWCGNTF